MVTRAWQWLKAHAWLAWIALGAIGAALLQWLTKRGTTILPQQTQAQRKAAVEQGKAEAHEAQAAELHEQAERLEEQAKQADEAAAREETADHGISGDDEEIARIVSARLRAGDKR